MTWGTQGSNETAAELAASVLEQLGVVGAGQSPSAEDSRVVTDAWASIHSQLSKEGLVPFASGSIPDWAQEPLTAYVAGKVAVKFGHRGAESQGLFLAGDRGYRDLQVQNHGGKRGVRTKTLSY